MFEKITSLYKESVRNVPILRFSWLFIATICILALSAYFKLNNGDVFYYAIGVLTISVLGFVFSLLLKTRDIVIKIALYILVYSIVVTTAIAVGGFASFILIKKPVFYQIYFPDKKNVGNDLLKPNPEKEAEPHKKLGSQKQTQRDEKQKDPLSNMYAHFPFDDDYDDKINYVRKSKPVNDGGEGITFEKGIIGSAIRFNNHNYLEVKPFQLKKEVSIAFWCKVENDLGNAVISSSPWGAFAIHFLFPTEKWCYWDFQGSENGDNRFAFKVPKNDLGGWHHFVMNASTTNKTMNVYIDGRFFDSRENLNFQKKDFESLIIGGYVPFGMGDYRFQGLVDDLRFYNRLLTKKEVDSLYKQR